MSKKSNHSRSAGVQNGTTNLTGHCSSQLWDDELLIKSYDQAQALIKETVAKRIAESTNTATMTAIIGDSPPSTTTLLTPPADDDAADKTAGATVTYQPGDAVRCTFSEDGVDYEADILSVSGDHCWVRYVGYNNEEQVAVDALVASWGEEVRAQQMADAVAYNETATTTTEPSAAFDDAPEPTESGARGAAASTTTSSARSQKPAALDGMVKSKKSSRNHMQKMFDRQARLGGAMQMPPPPPMPPMCGMLAGELGADEGAWVGGDSDSLSSMLMAWYMSGYYTGQYMAEKAAAARAAAAARRQEAEE